ncbi:MAG: SEL1-like repeat protein [bacterium]|nr:SEL1-like repeat protein [bacterium]
MNAKKGILLFCMVCLCVAFCGCGDAKRKRSSGNDTPTDPVEQCELAHKYYEKQNFEEAVRLYRLAAEQGVEKANFKTPLVSYSYLNNALLFVDPRNPNSNLTISSFSHLKQQLEDLFGRGMEFNGITLNEDLFNLEISGDEEVDHPLNEVAQKINVYIEQQANDFLQALFLNAAKTQSSTNDAIGNTTIERFIRNLNATNIE